jgi:glycosyltransferase involved in cell wall biosynthesis
MIIGINATAAIKQPRTGVEEYTYQLIKHLTMLPEAREHRFFLYLPAIARRAKAGLPAANRDTNIRIHTNDTNRYFDFSLPENFEIKILKWSLPFLWTQIRLAWEMLRRPPNVLFVPVHILPIIHPKNSVATIHGLEYEYFPKYYPLLHRLYLRWSTKYAFKHARKIISISESTKKDLVKLYGGDAGKIEVVHLGIEIKNSKIKNQKDSNPFVQRTNQDNSKLKINKPYILYLGRIERKKNIEGILEAYKILKEKFQILHQLVLAGSPGYGYQKIKTIIHNSKFIIHESGYISEAEKRRLLSNADIFLFPSFYEGFGLPVLEAQSADVPVVTSNNSCLPEIAGEGALFINPKNPAQIAQALKNIIDDAKLRDKLIRSGEENLKRFSWEKCARETLRIMVG